MSDLSKANPMVIERFRAGEEIPGMHRDRLLLLTTRGRKTGRRYTAPMMFHREGERVLVIASNAGATRHPGWYRNLLENPAVTVEIGDETYEATAEPLGGADREKTWATIKRLYPFFAEHEKIAGRDIPVVELKRRE